MISGLSSLFSSMPQLVANDNSVPVYNRPGYGGTPPISGHDYNPFGASQSGLLGAIGNMFSRPEQEAYQAIRNMGQQAVAQSAQMPGAQALFPQMRQAPNLAGPAQSMGPTAVNNSMGQPNFFPQMGKMPDVTAPGAPTMGRGGLLANNNAMGSNPLAAAMLGLSMIGGEDEEKPMSLPPGGGTPMMRPMAMPQMMSTGQMLRRR